MPAPDEIRYHFPFVLSHAEVEAPNPNSVDHSLRLMLYFKGIGESSITLEFPYQTLDWSGIEMAEYELVLKRKRTGHYIGCSHCAMLHEGESHLLGCCLAGIPAYSAHNHP